MNFVAWHFGDHARGAGHLSVLEDGALRRCLDVYYSTERALPAAVADVSRVVRASTKAEREAVAVVLREFFVLTADGWRHARADREIEAYRAKQDKARESAQARWSQREPQSERNANASPDGMRTHSEGNATRARTNPNPNLQEPSTKSQEEESRPPSPRKRGANSYPPDFERLWSTFPRKEAKAAALKAFEKLRPDAALLEAMLVAVARQAGSDQWVKEAGRFIPHLASWLKAERWLDEVLTASEAKAARIARLAEAASAERADKNAQAMRMLFPEQPGAGPMTSEQLLERAAVREFGRPYSSLGFATQRRLEKELQGWRWSRDRAHPLFGEEPTPSPTTPRFDVDLEPGAVRELEAGATQTNADQRPGGGP